MVSVSRAGAPPARARARIAREALTQRQAAHLLGRLTLQYVQDSTLEWDEFNLLTSVSYPQFARAAHSVHGE